MSQTHIYGLILAFMQSALIAILWLSGIYLRAKGSSVDTVSASHSGWTWIEMSIRISGYGKWVLGSGAFFLGILPIILALIQSTAWQTLGGSVWIPP